jgi:hypothetical protein
MRLRRVLHSEQERGEPAAMIQVQVADPYGVEVRPVESFLRHPMWRIGTAIQQQGAVSVCSQKRRRSALRMEDRSA